MTEKKEKMLQIVISSILFVIAILIDKLTNLNNTIMFFIYLISYIVAANDTMKEGIEKIHDGDIFNENVLMIIASAGAMLIGFLPNTEAMYPEGIFVILFYQLGELFELIADGKTEAEIKSLMDIRPDYANLSKDGKEEKVSPDKVKIGDIIIVKPGEKVPLDGIIVEGKSTVNTLAITGESAPREVKVNDELYSGFINKNGTLKVQVTKTFENSTASRIIDLVKNASSKKSKSEKFITRFSKVYTPIVIVLAVAISIIPSIITGNIAEWLIRGLTFLIVSCPCALVISVPLSFFGGIGGASKKGVLFKGSSYLEKIAKMNTIIFDKTGTLTEGVFDVTEVHSNDFDKNELLHIVAHIENQSNHPIAQSLVSNYTKNKDINDDCNVSNIEEIEGYGVKGKVNGKQFYVGNEKLMDKINVEYKKINSTGTIVHVAVDNKYCGYILISDRIKKESPEAIKFFKQNGIKTIMLSGDKKCIVENIANKLGIDEYYGELLPEDKEKYVDEKASNENCIVGFVGDGINDSPSIARADIGISLGGVGQDAAIESAGVILMNDNILSLKDAIKIARKTMMIAKENIVVSIAVKILVLILSAFGIANMWMAVFADVGITILAVLNAMRTLR